MRPIGGYRVSGEGIGGFVKGERLGGFWIGGIFARRTVGLGGVGIVKGFSVSTARVSEGDGEDKREGDWGGKEGGILHRHGEG